MDDERRCDVDHTEQHTQEGEEALVQMEQERLIKTPTPELDHSADTEPANSEQSLHDGEGSDEETDPLCDSDSDRTQSCGSSMQGSPLPSKKFLAEQMDSSPELQYVVNPDMAQFPLNKYLSAEDCHSCMTSTNVTPRPYRKFMPPESDAGTDLLPVCRICQLPGDDDDVLFSPCRCSGSLRYVHYSCLLKWIEVCSRKTKKPPKCELCFFPYIRHKRFKFHHWRLPKVNSRDKCLHTAFFFNLVIMIGCAVATVLCFLSDKGQITNLPKNKVELTSEEVITLACGVFFFVSFFIAMTVEIKAKHTVYKLFIKFLTQNTEWQIEPYDRSKDPAYNIHPSHIV